MHSRLATGCLPLLRTDSFDEPGATKSLMACLPWISQGLKIAVVVNDVASVNIDSKLVRERTGIGSDENMADCVELQNGCACCNASDELLQVTNSQHECC